MLFQKSSRLWPSHVSNLNFYIFFSSVHFKMSESYKRLASNQLSSTLTQIGCGLPRPSAALRVRKPWVTLSLRGTAAVRASRSVAGGSSLLPRFPVRSVERAPRYPPPRRHAVLSQGHLAASFLGWVGAHGPLSEPGPRRNA